ncbi:MAG: gliding motility-associated C-terminal domain-containing protein [Candidatus Cyclobacteriaceae bacterium M3_2C_046]
MGKVFRIFYWYLVVFFGLNEVIAQKVADFEFDQPSNLLLNTAGPDGISINPYVQTDGEGLYSGREGEHLDVILGMNIFQEAETIVLVFDFKSLESYSGLIRGGLDDNFRIGYQQGLGFRVVYFTESDTVNGLVGVGGDMEPGERAEISFIYEKETGKAQLLKNEVLMWESTEDQMRPGEGFYWNVEDDNLRLGGNAGGDAALNQTILYSFKAYLSRCIDPIPPPEVVHDSICGSGTAHLKANGADSGNYVWYYDQKVLQGQAGGQLETPFLNATDTFKVAVVEEGCEGESAEVIAYVRQLPASPAITHDTICGSGTGELQAQAGDLAIYWFARKDDQNEIARGQNYVTDSLVASTSFYTASFDGDCLSEKATVTVQVLDLPDQPPINHDSICGPGMVTLEVPDLTGITYRWYSSKADTDWQQKTNGSLEIMIEADTNLWVQSFDGQCSSKKSAVKVDYLDPPVLEAGEDHRLLQNQSVILQPSGDYITFSWNPIEGLDNPALRNPTASPDQTTTYRVSATNNSGCEASDSLTVFVYEGITIPNAFSPNDDGHNDTWIIPLIELYPQHQVYIFNRWGNMVYKSNGNYVPWDGKIANTNVIEPGTYIYKIQLNPSEPVFQGELVVIQ